MKELAIETRVDDRERNEYIRRRLIIKLTEDQFNRLNDLLKEIWENKPDGRSNNYPKPELFGAQGEVTFKDREWEGQYADEPAEDDEIYRNNVSLMDYLIDYKGEKHDRFNIVNALTVYDEDGKEVPSFCGFYNF